MFPWSVMPTAGWPSAAAVATTSAMRAAPSSIENSVCRWRWTNDLANERSPVHGPSSTGAVHEPVENHTGVVRATLTRVDRARPRGAPRLSAAVIDRAHRSGCASYGRVGSTNPTRCRAARTTSPTRR